MKRVHWQVSIGLALIYLAIVANMTWLWGLMLLLLAAMDLWRGQTWLIQPVPLHSNPLLFSLLVFHWLLFGFYWFAELPLYYLMQG